MYLLLLLLLLLGASTAASTATAVAPANAASSRHRHRHRHIQRHEHACVAGLAKGIVDPCWGRRLCEYGPMGARVGARRRGRLLMTTTTTYPHGPCPPRRSMGHNTPAHAHARPGCMGERLALAQRMVRGRHRHVMMWVMHLRAWARRRRRRRD